jgi:hypothetical protein
MADQGTIGRLANSIPPPGPARTAAYWEHVFDQVPDHSAATGSMGADSLGVISGVVLENGVPVPNCIVYMYYRRNGAMVGRRYTPANGTFSFGGLRVGVRDYLVVALDPDAPPDYNSLIYDRIAPV